MVCVDVCDVCEDVVGVFVCVFVLKGVWEMMVGEWCVFVVVLVRVCVCDGV